MSKKRNNKTNIYPDPHLRDYLQSSYTERFNWLEKTIEFTKKIKKKKCLKIKMNAKQ